MAEFASKCVVCVKVQRPSRQRYYFMIGGFVLGVLVGVLI